MEIRRILYPTDFSESAKQAFSHALFLAEEHGAELHVLHAVVLHDDDPNDARRTFPEPVEILKKMFEITDSDLAKLLAGREHKVSVKEVKRRGFSAVDAILDYAAEIHADLIVMGTHGRRGPARLFLGSVAQGIVRRAECPVLTLRKQDKPRKVEAIDSILVPVDFSRHSRKAVAEAKQLAAHYGAGLKLLHVVEDHSYPYFYAPTGAFPVAQHLTTLRRRADEALVQLAKEVEGPDCPYETWVVSGRPATEIVRFAREQECDMLVIATHGLSGLERLLLGSTTEEVTRTAPCPVFTVKMVDDESDSKARAAG